MTATLSSLLLLTPFVVAVFSSLLLCHLRPAKVWLPLSLHPWNSLLWKSPITKGQWPVLFASAAGHHSIYVDQSFWNDFSLSFLDNSLSWLFSSVVSYSSPGMFVLLVLVLLVCLGGSCTTAHSVIFARPQGFWSPCQQPSPTAGGGSSLDGNQGPSPCSIRGASLSRLTVNVHPGGDAKNHKHQNSLVWDP